MLDGQVGRLTMEGPSIREHPTLPPLEELQVRRTQLEREIDVLGQSFSKLKEAQELFVQNVSTLTSLKSASLNQEILIPLTNSVYAVGYLANNEKVMVDIGTGYFVEKSMKDADEYYVRKIKFLQEQLSMLGKILNQKRENHQVINQAMQTRVSALKPEEQQLHDSQ